MIDHATIESENITERYLMGQLDKAVAARFEEHFLDCQGCLERLELSKQLYQGLQGVAAEEIPRTVARASVLTWILRRGGSFQVSLMLGLLALMILPWALLVPEGSRLRQEQSRLTAELARALAPQAHTPVYTLSPERSAVNEEPSTRIRLDTTAPWLALALQLPPNPEAGPYRVHLLDGSGTSRWRSGPMEPDAKGRVSFQVHASWLRAGRYDLELASISNQEADAVTRFSFAVQRGTQPLR